MIQKRFLLSLGVWCLLIATYLEGGVPSESRFITQVSQQRLQKTVRELVKCGNRLGGTKSGDKAAAYVADKFKSYGLKPEIIEDPEKLCYTNDNWLLQIESPKKLRGLIQHEWLAGFSPSLQLDTAQLLFIQSISDIDEDRVNNCAVLIDQHPTSRMYKELVDAGAWCILAYQDNIKGAYDNCAMISILKESEKNKIPVFNISNVAGRRLREEIAKGVRIVVRCSAKTTIRPGHPKTVVATIPGKSSDYYIICAHGDSDSGGPGADDNASGVSGVLEVARIYNSMVKNKKLPLPKKTIKFIVWGSEYHSSRSYVKAHEDSLNKILGVINYDEIGVGKSRHCLYFEGNDVSQNHDILKLFEHIGEEYAGKKGFWKEATTNPSQGGTDSYVFLPNSLDDLDVPNEEIPSMTVFTAAWNEPKPMKQTRGWLSKAWKGNPDSVIIDYSPFYHSSLDIPALTTDKEPANMVWGVNAVGIALMRLLWQ